MAHEPKYRGWSEKENRWIYGSLIQKSAQYGSRFYVLELTNDEELEDREIEIYYPTSGQNTGLKDRNGNDIYEGDICVLKSGIFTDKYSAITVDEIKFENAAFTFDGDPLFAVNDELTILSNTQEIKMFSPKKVIQAHQYLYYVLANPVISDRDYDETCKYYNVFGGGGSDREQDYSHEVKRLANLLLLAKNHSV